ncbi:MAG: hypothetical protein AAF960_07230 [Bacteroidota bacterium]
MKRIENLLKTAFFLAGLLYLATPATAQCGKFTEASNPSDAETFHVLYRQDVKSKNFDAAYDNWEKAYAAAPAADGLRDVHYTDGIKILKDKFKKETDAAKKAELSKRILDLYAGAIQCLESGSIKLPKTKAEDRVAYHLGRQGFDMFYDLQTPYSQTRATLESAMEKGGMDTEYIVLDPYARIVVHQFTNDKMDKAESRAAYAKLTEIAEHNMANNAKYKAYYKQAKASVDAIFAQIENNIFDCDYFVEKFKPEFEADPDNPEVMKKIIPILKRQGCESGNAFLDELEGKYEKYAIEENARRQAEFEANNPGIMANKLYKEGKFKEAIAKYREALEAETDDDKKAGYYFSIASIQGRKLGQNGQARTNAYNAAKLRSGWGRPYMLIGDLYAKSSKNCGKDGYTRGLAVIAAIDKYRKAKSVDSDPEIAQEANKKIGIYSGSIPPKEDVFMRGMQGGKTAKVGCWIGETVTVRYN